jgi:hypothetical protein
VKSSKANIKYPMLQEAMGYLPRQTGIDIAKVCFKALQARNLFFYSLGSPSCALWHHTD